MEASSKGGRGEVRRLHIIYFLSRMGRIEHPHLIRVHHLHRNGVHVRDVKRWMAELRGKDMPESFAWSYKRRYKNGYVWQDLQDDDLITPISDNEYILKGSEIFPPIPLDGRQKHAQVKVGIEDKNHEQLESPITIPTRTLSEIYQESPLFSSDGSTLTDDSTKQEQDESEHISNEQLEIDNFDTLSSSSFCSNLLAKKNKMNNKKAKNKSNNQDNDNITNIELKMGSPNSSSLSQSRFAKGKSNSGGASKMIRNLMTCGAVDTNDAALVAVNISAASNKAEICTTRVFGNTWNPQQQQDRYSRSFDGVKDSKKQQQQCGFCTSKVVPAAYKPVGAPTCLQCGKSFKPEKLHTHMKSCKGMKASAKTAAAFVRKTHPSSMNSMNELIPIS